MEPSAHISSTYLKVMLQDNQELIEKLSTAPNIDVEQLFEQEYIPGDLVTRAFTHLAEHGVQSLLLSYGQRINVSAHGPVGYAMLSAPDLHTALTTLANYSVIRSSLSSAEFNYKNNRAEIRFGDKTNHPLTKQWILENVVHITLNLIENITTHATGNQTWLSFANSRPSYAEKLETFFGVPCQFNARFTGISIPESWCRVASPLYDEQAFRINLAKCRELKQMITGSDNLAKSVYLQMQNYFEQRQAGLTTAKELPSLESLAKQHFISSRTFNRALSKHNTSYRAILEEVRRSNALALLRDTHLSASKISYYLAYQEPANFNRAFKRWFATTPVAWRRNQPPAK